MSLFTMSAEFVRWDLPLVPRELVVRTRKGVWVEVFLDKQR